MVITWRLRAVSELRTWVGGGAPQARQMGQDPRVQSVGLGQRSGGLGEVPDLPPPPAVSKPPVASSNTKAGSRSTIWGISPSIPVSS